MLPLLVAGAALFTAGKVANDMSEAKKLGEEAQSIADEGNSYLEEVKEYQRDITDYLNRTSSYLKQTKIDGFKTLLNNYVYFKDLDLNLGKYEKYKKSLEEEIVKNGLSIRLSDVLSLNKDIKTLTSELGINIDKYTLNKNELVEDVGIETVAGIAAHGILAAGIGGTAALVGVEFLAATGVGAILLAPFVISVSGDKVDEAKKAKLKAEQFRQEAQLEKDKWKGLCGDIALFYFTISQYNKFIYEIIDISDYWIKKYQLNPNNMEIIIKNIITLAYLNKFLNKYPSIQQEEMGEFDRLINWINKKAVYEINEFAKLQEEVRKIKGKEEN